MVKRLKSGGFASSSPEIDPKLAVIKRDQGRLNDPNEHNNQRHREANKCLALKSYKKEDYPLPSDADN